MAFALPAPSPRDCSSEEKVRHCFASLPWPVRGPPQKAERRDTPLDRVLDMPLMSAALQQERDAISLPSLRKRTQGVQEHQRTEQVNEGIVGLPGRECFGGVMGVCSVPCWRVVRASRRRALAFAPPLVQRWPGYAHCPALPKPAGLSRLSSEKKVFTRVVRKSRW